MTAYTKTIKKAANLLIDAKDRQNLLSVHYFSDGFFLSCLCDYANTTRNEELSDFIKKRLSDHKQSRKLLKNIYGLHCASAAVKINFEDVFYDLALKGEQLSATALSNIPATFQKNLSNAIEQLLPNFIRIEELMGLSDFLCALSKTDTEIEAKKRALFSKVFAYDELLLNTQTGLYYPIYNVKRAESLPKGDTATYPTAYMLYVYSKLKDLATNKEDAQRINDKIKSTAHTLSHFINNDGYISMSAKNNRNDSLSTTLYVYGVLHSAELFEKDIISNAENIYENIVEDVQLKNDLLSLPYTVSVSGSLAFLPFALSSRMRQTNDMRTALAAFALASDEYFKKYGDKLNSEFVD